MRPCVTDPLRIRGAEFGGPKPLICVPLMADDLGQLLSQAHITHDLKPDVVEWRVDAYRDLSVASVVEAARQMRSVLDTEPIIFTLRISV